MHMMPAEYVIHILGGVRAAAIAIGRSPGSISKWRKTRKKNVPSAAQKKILEIAKRRQLDINPDDLIYGRTVIISNPS